MARTYSAFYQDDHAAIIYRCKSNDGTLEELPQGAVPIPREDSSYFRRDGGDKLEFAYFQIQKGPQQGEWIVVKADDAVPRASYTA